MFNLLCSTFLCPFYYDKEIVEACQNYIFILSKKEIIYPLKNKNKKIFLVKVKTFYFIFKN